MKKYIYKVDGATSGLPLRYLETLSKGHLRQVVVMDSAQESVRIIYFYKIIIIIIIIMHMKRKRET